MPTSIDADLAWTTQHSANHHNRRYSTRPIPYPVTHTFFRAVTGTHTLLCALEWIHFTTTSPFVFLAPGRSPPPNNHQSPVHATSLAPLVLSPRNSFLDPFPRPARQTMRHIACCCDCPIPFVVLHVFSAS
ncbi:hypothetical protein Cob_v006259 [Colletotrichum orbiculare MAFF 240422]|uniref:Uncharacterized protein n=1 Tax=Colletotrichum orbiculare (strain 104-T / ATCC 96160 / CBS 514.97 / LARS 414 / MAFF 240422) TaxID=1213857 RepID=A0A484FSB0_COLOR|nr:hypothetical protein Cob_v006259 [Colletotrichum orbiculare MAFF 240422]